jgi:hypothetical protein
VSVRLPVIRQSTHINDVLNHDIYMKNDHFLKPSSSLQHLTFNREGSTMSKDSSANSKFTKRSSLHSHSKSTASVFKEKYDKNIASYMQTLEDRYNNRKNYSSSISKLMSPNFSTTTHKKFDL